MRVIPTERDGWFTVLLFPFKAYLPLGIICLFIWREATAGHGVRGGLAAATNPVVCGYMLCTLVFLLVAGFRFATHRRHLVAETLLFAAVAFTIALLLLPWCATS